MGLEQRAWSTASWYMSASCCYYQCCGPYSMQLSWPSFFPLLYKLDHSLRPSPNTHRAWSKSSKGGFSLLPSPWLMPPPYLQRGPVGTPVDKLPIHATWAPVTALHPWNHILCPTPEAEKSIYLWERSSLEGKTIRNDSCRPGSGQQTVKDFRVLSLQTVV